MSKGPWDHRAAAARAHSHLHAPGHLRAYSHVRASDHLRASDADREQVLEFLKTAFVQGRLSIDELDTRAGQALVSRTYGELAVLTADIPRGPVRALPHIPAAPAAAPAPAALRTPASAKAAVWAAFVIAALPAVWAAFLTFYGGFVILFLVAFTGLTLSTGPPRRDKNTIAG